MYKCLREPTTDIFQLYFQTNRDVHGRDTRNPDTLHEPHARPNIRKCGMKINGAVIWNTLPVFICNFSSLILFKQRLRKYIIDSKLTIRHEGKRGHQGDCLGCIRGAEACLQCLRWGVGRSPWRLYGFSVTVPNLHYYLYEDVRIVMIFIMTSSNGNIFRVTGHVCGEFTGLRWIPHTKASDAELWCFLWFASE